LPLSFLFLYFLAKQYPNMKNYFERTKKWLLEKKYNGEQSVQYFKDLERLKKGEPLDYVIGFRDFLNCKIDLSLKPLIPREETEYWLEKVIIDIKNKYPGKKLKILDLFSGSGCIGIVILKHLPNSIVIFGEKSPKFIKQIKINLKLNKIKPSRYKIIQTDTYSNIKGKFDFIFANPPYLSKKRISKIQKPVLKYEPKIALFAKNNGLYFIEKLIQQSKNFLKPEGEIFIEFDSWQKKKIEEILKENLFYNFQFSKDQFNRYRYLKLTLK